MERQVGNPTPRIWLVSCFGGPSGGGRVHGVDDLASPEDVHARHRGSCGGDGPAARARSRSCARRARSASRTFLTRALCRSAGARRRFGTYLKVDGRGAGDLALSIRADTAADTGSAPVGRHGLPRSAGGMLPLFAKNEDRFRPCKFLCARSRTPTSTIRAYLHIFQRFLQR